MKYYTKIERYKVENDWGKKTTILASPLSRAVAKHSNLPITLLLCSSQLQATHLYLKVKVQSFTAAVAVCVWSCLTAGHRWDWWAWLFSA